MPEDFLPKPFRCERTQHDGVTRIRPEGDLDISTVPELEEHLREALYEGARRIVIDLSGLDFMDSTGITLVTRWNNASRRDGFELALIRGDDRIQRLFELTGLDGYFTFISGQVRERPMHERAQDLIDAAGGQPPGSLRAALANAMVGLKKRYYGRGPEAAKAYIEDDYIFVVMEGGLTRNEETLLAAGKQDLVRQYRLAFQETVGPTAISAVEELSGRTVIGYHSQVVFEPMRAFEIFVLAPES